jgi:hypothetical protein
MKKVSYIIHNPVTDHPVYRYQRNKRKRMRWKKAAKRMGITHLVAIESKEVEE